MDLATFGLGTTTATRLEAMGGNGFGNFQAGNHHCDTLGRQREAMDLVTFGLGITTATRLGGNGRQWTWEVSGWEPPLRHAWEARGGNGFGNFRAGNHHCDTLGKQRDAMDLVTFRLGTTTATRLGGNGRQWMW